MKTRRPQRKPRVPRPPKPEPSLEVTVARLNAPDWRERYWAAVCILMPELRDQPAINEKDGPSQPAESA